VTANLLLGKFFAMIVRAADFTGLGTGVATMEGTGALTNDDSL